MLLERLEKLAGASIAFGALFLAWACSGQPFCEESRTCPRIESSGGEGGASPAETSSGEGGDAAGAEAMGVGSEAAGAAGQAPNECEKDAECDDGDSCNGTETCKAGQCNAGTAIQCPAGLQCSAVKNNACVFATNAPWIVYTADIDGRYEAFAVKSDLLGVMEPVNLKIPLTPGWQLTFASNWSADGSMLEVNAYNVGLDSADSYWVHFGEGLPDEPLPVSKGMLASKTSETYWFRSGNFALLQRDDGLHSVDLREGATTVSDLPITGGYTFPCKDTCSKTSNNSVRAEPKDEKNALFYGVSPDSNQAGFYLAQRAPTGWSQQLIAEIPQPIDWSTTVDSSAILYWAREGSGKLLSLWSLPSEPGSTPVRLTRPVASLALLEAPQGGYFLEALVDDVTGKTTIYSGENLSSLTVLKADDRLPLENIFDSRALWSPDSSRAALFQDSAVGRQLVLHQSHNGNSWLPLPYNQLATDGAFWSPKSSLLALVTRASSQSLDSTLTLVSADDGAGYNVETTQQDLQIVGFSAGGDYLVYKKGTSDSYYLDLRAGLAVKPKPIDDPIGWFSFAKTGTAALYSRTGKSECRYIDVGSETPDRPVVVGGAEHPALGCTFQPRLP